MYNGYRHQISNKQLEDQRAQLEETNAQRLAAKALGLDPDYPSLIATEMTERVTLANWQRDNWDWVCEVEAQASDHADQTDEQIGLRYGG